MQHFIRYNYIFSATALAEFALSGALVEFVSASSLRVQLAYIL